MSITDEELFLSQSGLVSAEAMERMAEIPVTIIGAGATGGAVMLSLPKTGFKNITVIDFDTVSEANYSNQIWGTKQIGMKKVDALKSMVDFIGLEGDFKYIDDKVTEDNLIIDINVPEQIVILTVDTMTARKAIVDHISLAPKGLIVDPRIGGWLSVCVSAEIDNPIHMQNYREVFLFSDENAAPISCTEKALKTVADSASQLVTNACTLYCVKGGVELNVVNKHCDTQRVDYIRF